MAALKIINPPVKEPLTLQEAKASLKVDDSSDDDLITSLIISAREYCEDYQGKKYITQTLQMLLDTFPDIEIEFQSCSPVQSVTSIKYTDSAGVAKTIQLSSFILDKDSFVNRVVPAYGALWPSVTLQPINAICVEFVAGYGDDGSAVPEAVKQAMVLHMKLLYDDYRPDERERLERSRDALLGMRRVIPV